MPSDRREKTRVSAGRELSGRTETGCVLFEVVAQELVAAGAAVARAGRAAQVLERAQTKRTQGRQQLTFRDLQALAHHAVGTGVVDFERVHRAILMTGRGWVG